jgi:hypothetical protein
VLVDTCVWSLALRRARPSATPIVRELAELVNEGRVVVIGPVRQELLSGVKSAPQFRTLRDRLRAFPDIELDTSDFEEAAACFNRCRALGIQGSNTDFLITAVAARRGMTIFTTDVDFRKFGRALSFRLHEVRSELASSQ